MRPEGSGRRGLSTRSRSRSLRSFQSMPLAYRQQLATGIQRMVQPPVSRRLSSHRGCRSSPATQTSTAAREFEAMVNRPEALISRSQSSIPFQ